MKNLNKTETKAFTASNGVIIHNCKEGEKYDVAFINYHGILFPVKAFSSLKTKTGIFVAPMSTKVNNEYKDHLTLTKPVRECIENAIVEYFKRK